MNAPLVHVNEPPLEFRFGQKLVDPRDGLFVYGPVDGGACSAGRHLRRVWSASSTAIQPVSRMALSCVLSLAAEALPRPVTCPCFSVQSSVSLGVRGTSVTSIDRPPLGGPGGMLVHGGSGARMVRMAAGSVASKAEVEAGVATLAAELGSIDILVNNAGIPAQRARITDDAEDCCETRRTLGKLVRKSPNWLEATA